MYLFIKFFGCEPFLKSLLNLLQYCFCFMSWFYGPRYVGILAPPPGIESSPPTLEGKVLTTGLQGKSILMLPPNDAFFLKKIYWSVVYL